MRLLAVSLIVIGACSILVTTGDIVGCGATDVLAAAASPPECGDADSDGEVDIDDVKFLVIYVYLGGSAPDPFDTGDVNCDRRVNSLDIAYLLSYIFRGGSRPCADCT